MRFLLIAFSAQLLVFGLVPTIALIGNFDQAISVQWWKLFFGPFAWFITTYAWKDGNGLGFIVVATICLLSIVPVIRHDTFPRRILAAVGIFLWLLLGLTVALAWA